MDPAALASMAVSFIAPYLAKAGESLASQAGTAAVDAVKALYAAVKQKFAKDPYAEQTLKHVEQAPDSPNWQAALTAVLEEKIQADQAFAQELARQIEAAKSAGAGDAIQQNVTVSGHGKTGDIQVVGKIEGSHIDLSQKHKP